MTFFFFIEFIGMALLNEITQVSGIQISICILFYFFHLGIDSPELQIVPDCCGFFHIHIELKHIVKCARPGDNGLFTCLCCLLDA